jgi:sulfotransferase
MTDKTIHFIAGLPRSGSTLLCNILNQNPRFHATSTSGILDIVLAIRNQWENVNEFAASPNKVGKNAVMKGILPNYYENVTRPVVFDKSRGWTAHVELAEYILDRKVKILVPVRNLVDILSSFEKLYRTQAHEWQFPQEKSHFFQWQTVEGRADVWMRDDQPVGIAYNRIRDAVARGFGDRLLFIEFEHLTAAPEHTMKQVYKFIEEDYFPHDYKNVEQTTSENDDIHGIPGLHIIRPNVAPLVSDARKVLGESVIQKYSGAEFWRK